MTIDPQNAGAANTIIERAKNILTTPQVEWDKIATEPADVNKLYMGYALPLALVAAAAGVIGLFLARFSLTYVLMSGVLQVVSALVGVFIMAFVTNALAPNFGSTQDQGQAHKLAVYGATAGFVGAIALIVPFLGGLIALAGAVYSLVLIYIGLPRLMKTPEDKRVGYFATIVVVCIVVGLIFNMVIGGILLNAMGPARPGYTFGQTQHQNTTPAGEVTLPGGGTVDLEAMRAQAEALQNGALDTPAIDPARLQMQLPQSLPGGFALASASSSSAMGSSQAEGVYRNGPAEMRVTIVHMGAIGAVAGMAASMNMQSNEQTADGYSRTQTIDGRVYAEEVNNTSRSATYGVVGRGVAVSVDGSNGVTLDQARAAVETIGVQRLEREFGTT